MLRKGPIITVLLVGLVNLSSTQLYAQEKDNGGITVGESPVNGDDTRQVANAPPEEKSVYFTIRMGQGGFRDDRSPLGKLGGGQIALDVKPAQVPVALSLSGEYYTNSANPTHSYEISHLTVFNLLYMDNLLKSRRANYFTGGGIGWLKVPKGEHGSDGVFTGTMYDIEAGINYRLFWKIGFYGIGKYLYAQKKSNGVRVIDFSEGIVLLGFTVNFGL